jgi:hypothetical protein
VKDDRSTEGKEKNCRINGQTYRTCRRFLGAFVTGLVIASAAWAADHREAPIVNGLPEGDIGDVFAFLDPNDPSRLVLSMGVNGFAIPAVRGSYSFSPEFLYQFKIDNNGDFQEDQVVQVVFTGTGATQQVRFIGPFAPDSGLVGAVNALRIAPPAATGTVGTILGSATGFQAIAGLFDDTFVFDAGQFNRILGGSQTLYRALTGTPLGDLSGRPVRDDGTSGVDAFGGINGSFINCSFPSSLIRGASSRVNIWGTVSRPFAAAAVVPDPGFDYSAVRYVQFERMGQAATSTVFVAAGTARDTFNAAIPSNDVATFSNLIPDTLTTTDTDGTDNTIAGRRTLLTTLGLTGPPASAPFLLPPGFANADKNLLRAALLPDVLRLDLDLAPTNLAVGQFGVSNGRDLLVDQVDIELGLLRELADVKFPDGSMLPGSGPVGSRNALDCSTLPLLSCPNRRVFVVLQGTDWMKPDSAIADVSISGNDRAFPSPFVFPFHPSAHPFPGSPDTTGFPLQQ